MSQIIKVNTKKFKISEHDLDNLASEFNGKVLAGAYDHSVGLFEIEFNDYDINGSIITAENLSIEFLTVLKSTYQLKSAPSD